MILQQLMRPRSGEFMASDLKTSAQWLIDALGGNKSLSGQRVTARTALGVAVYFACIRNISEDIAKLPMIVYKSLSPRGKERQTQHPLFRLLNEAPNSEMSAMTFRETLTAHALAWKGGFAEIVRRADGKPSALYPLDPTGVRVMRTADDSWLPKNSLFYHVATGQGQAVDLRPDQVLHVHGLGFDGVTGYAMADIAKEAIGAALASQKFGAAYFGNGAVATGFLKIPGVMKPEALKRLRESFADRHQGAEHAHKPVILEHGVEWIPSSNNPEKSQMDQTNRWHVEDVCRWFRCPPHKVGALLKAAGWSTLEATNLDYYTDSLMPWMMRWKQETKRRLILPSERDIDTEFLITAMLRMDSALRSAYYTAMFNIGAMSQNDIRDMEDLNPIGDEGNVYYVNRALIKATLAAQDSVQVPDPEADPEADPNLPVAPRKPADPDGNEESTADDPQPTSEQPQSRVQPPDNSALVFALLGNYEDLLAEAFGRVLHVEADRVLKAQKRPGFDAWAATFYETTATLVRREVGVIIDAMLSSIQAVTPGFRQAGEAAAAKRGLELAQAIAARHCARSHDELKDGALVEAWPKGERARQQARAEVAAMVDAAKLLSARQLPAPQEPPSAAA